MKEILGTRSLHCEVLRRHTKGIQPWTSFDLMYHIPHAFSEEPGGVCFKLAFLRNNKRM